MGKTRRQEPRLRRPVRAFRRSRNGAGAIGARPGPPFYDSGPSDKGIGLQLAYSLGRVGLELLDRCRGGDSARLPDRHEPAGLPCARPLLRQVLKPIAAGLDAARALHDQDSSIFHDFRDLHLLGLADAEHVVRRGVSA